MMCIQSCYFACLDLLIFCRSRCCRRGRHRCFRSLMQTTYHKPGGVILQELPFKSHLPHPIKMNSPLVGHSLLPLVLGISFRLWFLCSCDHLCSIEYRTLPLVMGPDDNPKNWVKLFSTWSALYFDYERNLSLMMFICNQMIYLWNYFLISLVTIWLLILMIYMEQWRFIWNKFWQCTVNNLLICSKYNFDLISIYDFRVH